MSSTSHEITKDDPTDSASGLTRLPSASPWYVKASFAPCAARVFAIPQAIEWSFATPMISPRLPCIRAVMALSHTRLHPLAAPVRRHHRHDLPFPPRPPSYQP